MNFEWDRGPRVAADPWRTQQCTRSPQCKQRAGMRLRREVACRGREGCGLGSAQRVRPMAAAGRAQWPLPAAAPRWPRCYSRPRRCCTCAPHRMRHGPSPSCWPGHGFQRHACAARGHGGVLPRAGSALHAPPLLPTRGHADAAPLGHTTAWRPRRTPASGPQPSKARRTKNVNATWSGDSTRGTCRVSLASNVNYHLDSMIAIFDGA